MWLRDDVLTDSVIEYEFERCIKAPRNGLTYVDSKRKKMKIGSFTLGKLPLIYHG